MNIVSRKEFETLVMQAENVTGRMVLATDFLGADGSIIARHIHQFAENPAHHPEEFLVDESILPAVQGK